MLCNNYYIMKKNIVYYKSSTRMREIKDESIDLVITSPPYFDIKDYSKNNNKRNKNNDIGKKQSFSKYLEKMDLVWKECERILRPNGKLAINVPLLPMVKKKYSTHYNRHIFDLQSEIQSRILEKNKSIFLLDIYIWNRTNSTKKLMFGSYPYPPNFMAQNTIEFITIYVKDGKPKKASKKIKKSSELTKNEWVSFTKQIWNIPIPNKKDKAFGIHPALMPEEIVNRLVKMYSFVGDVILDPFAGSGTTLKISKKLKRNYIGYELYKDYEKVINKKINEIK